MFDLLRQFVRREGHARVFEEHREGNFPLGRWVSRGRARWRKGLVTREQIRSLETVRGWTWSVFDEAFQRGLRVLKAYVNREGHARVPHVYREGDFNLGSWVLSRRREHASGRLAAGRRRELEGLSGWSWNPRDDKFLLALGALRRFAKREGHARVPFVHREGGIRLGAWITTQRRFHDEGGLPPERVRLLESVPGWTWQAREELFDDGMRALRAFVRREGHARVPRSWVEGGFRLGLWVANRRKEYRAGTLSKERVRILEEAPEWSWSVYDTSFERAFRHLRRFVRREGHAQVPTAHQESGFPLGAWVHKCRQRRGAMPAERARRLTALPGWVWNRFDWQFEEALDLLRAFARREGHARVASQHVERGFRLGAWVSHCRYRRLELSKTRRKALEGVRGWVWTLRLAPRRRLA